jgi:hypothetical protein
VQYGGRFICNDPLTYSFSADSFSVPTPDGGVSYFDRYEGTGEALTPYLIRDIYDLQAMQGFLGSDFLLNGDLDASATSDWNAGAGFMPVGNNGSSAFSGTFDGQGHKITDLTIDRPSTNYVGLFGYMNGATIRDVGLVGGNMTGQNYVGSLVGFNNYTDVENSYSTGDATGTNDVGGLVGYHYNDSTIDNSYATGNVSGSSRVGGLVGHSDYDGGPSAPTISNSYATGSVSGSSEVGGLVGYQGNSSTVSGSYATGAVSGTSRVGGLVGSNSSASTVTGSYAAGIVTGADSVGGLVGYNQASSIDNSYATGSVTGTDVVGGLVGYNYYGSIDNSYATGDVSGTNQAGGLVGRNYSDSYIDNAYATGLVNDLTGTLVGDDRGTTTNSYYDIDQSLFYGSGHAVYTDNGGWNFVNIWDAFSSMLPRLSWENYPPPPSPAPPVPLAEINSMISRTFNDLSNDMPIPAAISILTTPPSEVIIVDETGIPGMLGGDDDPVSGGEIPMDWETFSGGEPANGSEGEEAAEVVESAAGIAGEIAPHAAGATWSDTLNFYFDPERAANLLTNVRVVEGSVYVLDGVNEMSFLQVGDSMRTLYKESPKATARGEVVATVSGLKPGVLSEEMIREAVPPVVMDQTKEGMWYGTLRNPGKDVFVRKSGGEWMPAKDGMVILPGDEVKTAEENSVEVTLDGGKVGRVEIKEGSIFRISKAETNVATGDQTTILDLALGKILVDVKSLKGNSKFEVRTPTSITGVRGTVFEVTVKEKAS